MKLSIRMEIFTRNSQPEFYLNFAESLWKPSEKHLIMKCSKKIMLNACVIVKKI